MDTQKSWHTFWGHLEELRSRLIKTLLVFVACAVLFFIYVDPVLHFIVEPVGRLVFTSPGEAFSARVDLALLGGFLLALPVILYQLWQFVALGLTDQEKRYVKILGPLSLVCFMAGVVFAYFVLIPISLQFLLGFSTEWMQPMITVDKYISYVGTLMFGSGIVFELPLILFFLTKIGIATPEFLKQHRRYAIVIILIISAIVTPPDVCSQLLMAAPLLILYEVGIVVAQWAMKEKRYEKKNLDIIPGDGSAGS